MTRLARQKNDVPGPFHPARVDAALRNAAFDSSEIIAGNGVAWCEMEEKETLPHSFHCDPGLVLSEEGAKFHCFIGFDGQTRHLSDLVVETDEARHRRPPSSTRWSWPPEKRLCPIRSIWTSGRIPSAD